LLITWGARLTWDGQGTRRAADRDAIGGSDITPFVIGG